MRLLLSVEWRVWLFVNVAGILATFCCWHARLHTHLLGQADARTVLALEVIPVVMMSASLLTIRQQAAWIAASASRPLEAPYAIAAAAALTPGILTPPLVRGLLGLAAPFWLPGASHLDPVSVAPLGIQLPVFFFWSLVPTLLLCAGIGLLVEGSIGHGVGALTLPTVYLMIICLQSAGELTGFAGAPALDVRPRMAWFIAGLAMVAGVGLFGITRAGARRVPLSWRSRRP